MREVRRRKNRSKFWTSEEEEEKNTDLFSVQTYQKNQKQLRSSLAKSLFESPINSGNLSKTSSFSLQKLNEGLLTQINGESKQINKFWDLFFQRFKKIEKDLKTEP